MNLHSFHPLIAKEVGVNAAVLFQNILFWVYKNAANNKHKHGDFYWTYNSRQAFSKMFPYFTERQIAHALQKLESAGFIITGQFNKAGFDKTLWYTVDVSNPLIIDILQICNMDLTKMSDGSDKNVRPIPDINTDIKPYIINNTLFDELWKTYPHHKNRSTRKKAIDQFKKQRIEDHERIITSAAEYRRAIEEGREEGQFAPALERWIKDGKWEYDYSTSRAKPNDKSNGGYDSTMRAAVAAYHEGNNSTDLY